MKEKEIKLYGEYRTRRLVLEAWAWFAECVGTGACTYVTLMSLTPGTLYRGRLVVDSSGSFIARVWQADTPSIAAENAVAHSDWSGMEWKFKDFAISGTQDLTEYQQKLLYGIGKRTKMTYGSTSALWSYDARGQAIAERKQVGTDVFFSRQGYNAAGLLSWMRYPGGNAGQSGEVVNYTYTPQLLAKTAVGDDTYVQNALYDAAGRMDLLNLGLNGSNPRLQTDYVYNVWTTQGGRLQKIQSGLYAVPLSPTLQNLTYTYDNGGNVSVILDADNSNQKQCFQYDGLNRLIDATTSTHSPDCTAELGVGNYDEDYTYNPASGNLLTKTGVGTYIYDPNHKHAVASTSNGWSFQYDANGNQTNRTVTGGTYQLTYDAENRLVGVSGAATATFVYDGDGKRVKATINAVTTTYIGNYYEMSESSVRKYYFFGSLRVAMRQDSNLIFLLGDHLGSSSVSYQVSNGTAIPQYYKPWGEIRPGPNNSLPTDYTFTGQKWEASLSLMFFNARWYDPNLGRWTSPDTGIPESQGSTLGFDRYAFVANNPVKYIDPGGHCWGVASAIRGIPGYGTTCNNLDMALSIVMHPNASLKDRALAGGYVVLESAAHSALVVGTAGLLCSTVAPCVSAVESALGIGSAACADGDCTNEITTAQQAVQSVWQMNPFDRGVAIENMLGRSPELASNFPVIDRFQNGIATSIKSIDLMARSYQNIATLTRTVQGYVNTLANWQGATWGNVSIQANQITGRELILAIPPNASQAQLQALFQLQQSALGQGVKLILTTIK